MKSLVENCVIIPKLTSENGKNHNTRTILRTILFIYYFVIFDYFFQFSQMFRKKFVIYVLHI